jgi:hypothetical protein
LEINFGDNECGEEIHRVAGVLERSSAKKKRDSMFSLGVNHPAFHKLTGETCKNFKEDL